MLVSVSHVRLASPAIGVRSDISLLFHIPAPPPCLCRDVTASGWLQNSSPVKSRMPELGASRRVKVAISSAVIRALLSLPSALAMAACSLASGMATPPFPSPASANYRRIAATSDKGQSTAQAIRAADLFNHLGMIQSFRRSVSTCPSLGGPVLEFYPYGISYS